MAEQIVIVETPDESPVLVVEPAPTPSITTASQGLPGVSAPPGSYDSFYVHTQGVPASTWAIEHGLEKRPSVTIVDSSERVVVGNIEYTSDIEVVVSFSGAFSGKAYLN